MKRVLLTLLVIILVLGLSAPALAVAKPDDPGIHASLTLKGHCGTATGDISARVGKSGFSLDCETSLTSKLLVSHKQAGLRIAEGEFVIEFRGDCSSPLGDLKYIGRVTKVGYAPPTSYFKYACRLH